MEPISRKNQSSSRLFLSPRIYRRAFAIFLDLTMTMVLPGTLVVAATKAFRSDDNICLDWKDSRCLMLVHRIYKDSMIQELNLRLNQSTSFKPVL